jgi:hypothetical protein
MSIEAMKQALEAMKQALEWIDAQPEPKMISAGVICAALRQAIEQAEKQEPVAYIDHVSGKPKFINGYVVQTDYDIPLYTAPPRKEWVGLTKDEVKHYNNRLSGSNVAQEIESKLRGRNT